MAWISGRTWIASLVFLFLLAAGVIFVVIVREQQQSIPMPDESVVELTVEHEGTTYKLVHGDLFRVASSDRLVFVEKIYDTDFRKKTMLSKTDRFFGWIRTRASDIRLGGTLRTDLRTQTRSRT
jgi:hypothetical protein